MSVKNFKIGDLVWAKLKGYSFCPARVEKPPKNQSSAKNAHHFLYFYDSKNCAWVSDEWIVPLSEKGVKFSLKRKSAPRAINKPVNLSTEVSKRRFRPLIEEFENEDAETPKRPAQLLTEKKAVKFQKKVLVPKKEKHAKVHKRVPKKRHLADSGVTHQPVTSAKVRTVNDDYSARLANVSLSTESSSRPILITAQLSNKKHDQVQEKVPVPRKIPKKGFTLIKEQFKSEREENPTIPTQIPSRDSLGAIERKVVEPQEEKNTKVLTKEESGVNHYSHPANPGFNNLFDIFMASSPGPITALSRVPVVQPYNDPVLNTTANVCIPDPLVRPPQSPPFDIMTVSATTLARNIIATSKKIGFIGLGMIGRGIVKNLLHTGHDVTVWNRSPEKCVPFVNKAGAFQVSTPYDVVVRCDIIFCCISNTEAVRNVVFGNNGVLEGVKNSAFGSKGYVEMTSIHPNTSREVAEAITHAGGRYVEAPVSGSRQLAEEGELFVLSAGDRDLFSDCESCFSAFCKHAYYLSDVVGLSSRMSLIQSMLKGTVTVALAEAMALIAGCKLSQVNFMELLDMIGFNCPLMIERGKAMLQRDFVANTPLKYQQKEMNLAMSVADECSQPMLISSAANEIYKHSKALLRSGNYDATAVYLGVKY